MLASIFSKVTESLGKTFAYAGLLPAAILLLAISLHATSSGTFWSVVQALASDDTAWKSVAWLGLIWLACAFLFHALRAPIFSLFQIIPGGPLGRWLVFRRARRREQLKRRQTEIIWGKTALVWLQQLGLDRSRIGDFPYWILRPDSGQALLESRLGRETLLAVDRTAGDALNLSVRQSDAIAAGIFRLFLLAKFRHPADVERAIEAEIAEWRRTYDSARAKSVVNLVEQDIHRQFVRAFLACERFGEGAFIYPTELGNQISALDDYAEERYGIDTATMWNRLWWILPKDAKQEVSDARLALEALVNLTIALTLAALAVAARQVSACGLTVAFDGSSCDTSRTLVFIAVICILAILVYRGVNFAMEVLSIKTTTLIDMYRLPMLQQLGFSPGTIGDEMKLHAELKGFFTQSSALEASRPIGPPRKKPSDETT